ncbi:S8 family serine peptidase [Salinithrix halophila]|uniref:S8 family serine peptidase n=1 Tax=Salinithrix halophila TaxID=1485204 RepID=A0ABV8JH11_9BACL
MNKKVGFAPFIWTLCALLLLMGLLPQATLATEGKESISFKETKEQPAKEKISKKLKQQFDRKKTVTFLIKMKAQANTEKAAKKAAGQAKKQKQTAARSELMKRSAVVSTLRATASETQTGLKEFLKKEKKAGRVKTYQSFYIVNAMAITGTEATMEKVAAFPEVEKVLPNETRHLIGLDGKKTGSKTKKAGTQAIEWNIEQIGAPQVWEMGIDGAGTVVANIDTGVQWDHPSLKEQYRGFNPAEPDQPNHEYNWFDAVSDRNTPYDDLAHGTHTMGTMVGREPDGSNQIGVAPGAKWIAVKAFSAGGGSDVDLLEAGEWILAPKDAAGNPHPEKAPDVVNNSWGGGSGLDEWYRPMVTSWRAADIFPEFSAGNIRAGTPGGPGSVASPANYPESFATGATDIDKRLASFSLQGPSPYDETKPEVSAPGVNVRSAVPGGAYEGGWNGTSMSGPHVSAVVALLKQANASLTVNDIEEILTNTADPLTDDTFPQAPNNGYGHGLVNAYQAVSSVQSGLGQVRGQVLKEGQDEEEPTFEHRAPSETFAGMDLPLTVQVQDNISVTEVKLEYRAAENEDWQSVDAARTAGNYKNGTYQAVLRGDAIQTPELRYRWKMKDYGGHEVISDTYQVTVKPGITVGYKQDFESEPDGWASSGTLNSWEWGKPASGPQQAASGEKAYATNLSGNYENRSNMTLRMPPIDLSEGSSFLKFKHWYELERNYDYGHVLVSTDQKTWTQLARYNDTSNSWQDAVIDLSAYAGKRIYLAFNVTTDSSIVKAGWYLDDIVLTDQAETAAAKDAAKSLESKTLSTPAKGKKAVKPETMKPSSSNNLMAPTAPLVKNQPKASPNTLPLSAQVSVLESGRSVTTNPADGSYVMKHPAGEFTLRAETYGFRSEDQRVTIERDGLTRADFTLEPIPQGTVSGTVTNQRTGEPVAGATLHLVEDAAIPPVRTDENGHFEIKAFEGTYTLKVSAPHYYGQEASITIEGNDTVSKNLQLKPFIGYPGEIGYDDGSAENARAFHDAGNAWAVKMSLEKGKEKALVTGGLFRFWNTEWPVPGGTEFKVAVYDAKGPEGSPGKKLAGPYEATALRNGEWTVVDLADKGIFVDGDFYMVYIQTKPNPNAPGLATDENGSKADRSWQMAGGTWSPTPASEGNYMIRARVSYEVDTPVITAPTDGVYTNQSKVTVKGQAAPATQVKIQSDGKEIASVPAQDDGSFSAEVTLSEGRNTLTATASTDKGTTDPSAPVTVILDQIKPVLTITKPTNGMKTNREAVTVKGKATDEHLDWVKVNGVKASVSPNGSYSLRMLLEEGENRITVTTSDKAGNQKQKRTTIHAKFNAPAISDLKPNKDKWLKTGQSVKIELNSEAGLKGSYIIRMPLVNPTSVTEFPLQETSDGHYVGYYTATKNLKNIRGAEIEVILRDDYGNVSTKRAKGKLYINTKK